MAAIAVVAAKVAILQPKWAEIYDFIAAETITAGQAVYLASTGKVGLAAAGTAGKQQFRGIALNGGGAGAAISVLKKGHVAGFTLSGAYDSLAYLSDTAGGLDTSVGTMTVNCGRVTAMSDSSYTKILWVEADWLRAWS